MRQSKVIISLIATYCGICAEARDLQTAQTEAQQRLSQLLNKEVMLAPTAQMAAPRSGTTSTLSLPYYHFTDTEQRAFVLVAGSDYLPAIIGYGELDGNTDVNEMPEALTSWLEAVAETEDWYEKHPDIGELQREALTHAQNATEVQPLMSCQWGQDAPFSNNCPTKSGKKAPTGCFATAMAQVLYTQRFPEKSTGSVSYWDNGSGRSANLEGVKYDYTKMLDSYQNGATNEQKSEVAKLCYNLGVAANMQYGSKTSTSNAELTAKGLAQNFKCTKVVVLDRLRYSLDDWNELLQNELQCGRPMIFSASSETFGHAFVLDGVDASGLYHVNWGWDGLYNGYFDISVLRSDYSSLDPLNTGFYKEQKVIMNICDPQKTQTWHCPVYMVYANEPETLKKGQTATFTAFGYNGGVTDQQLYTGVTLKKANGTTYEQKFSSSASTIPGCKPEMWSNGYFDIGYQYQDITFKYTIPSNLPNGDYKLYLTVKDKTTGTIEYLHQQHTYKDHCWTLKVEGSQLTLSDTYLSYTFAVSDWDVDGVLRTIPTKIHCKVKNTGSERIAARFVLGTTSPDASDAVPVSGHDGFNDAVTLDTNESQTLNFVYTPTKVGSLTLKLWAATFADDYEVYQEVGKVTWTCLGIEQVRMDEEEGEPLIYDLLGKVVKMPTSGTLKPGIYVIKGEKRVIR